MLNDVIENQKNDYLMLNLLMSPDKQVSEAIKKAFSFCFYPMNGNMNSFFEKHFQLLMDDSGLVQRISEAQKESQRIRCAYFETDSSKIKSGTDIFRLYLSNAIKRTGLASNDDEVYPFELHFHDRFVDAIKHGNKAAPQKCYNEDELKKYFESSNSDMIEAKINKNKKNKVLVEVVLWDKTFITRFSDMGEGIKPEKHVEENIEETKEMINNGTITERYDSKEHRFGLLLAKQMGFDVLFEKTKDYFQTTLVKYVD